MGIFFVWIYTVAFSVLLEGEWLASRSGRFVPRIKPRTLLRPLIRFSAFPRRETPFPY